MKQYMHLIGKTKKEILQELGDEYNHYPSGIWTYVLRRTLWGRKKIMILYFREQTVETIKIYYSW